MILGEMGAFLLFCLAVAAYALPHGNLTPAQIGSAKKQCQLNCAHVSSKGRGVILHNRCVQTCWNEFFQSMMDKPMAHKPTVHKPATHKSVMRKPVMHNVAGTKRGILNSGHNRMVRGAPSSASRLLGAGALLLALLVLFH